MADTLELLIGDYVSFLTNLTESAARNGLSLSGLEIDHICYRCASNSEYIDHKRRLQSIGATLLVESMIARRPIAIFEFQPTPIQFGEWSVRCLELASPKFGRIHSHGLEHAEAVIGAHLTPEAMHNSRPLLDSYISTLPATLSFSYSDKSVNGDACINLGAGMSLKLHARPIYEVVRYEIESGSVEAVPEGYFD